MENSLSASSENVMGSITETCCEAEIKDTHYNMHLKCYTEKVDNKDRKLCTDTPEEVNNRGKSLHVCSLFAVRELCPGTLM